ncbi:MAG: hypothetical protein JWO13_4098 [Acidobacteriales bacterium]|nr:hypothetical protein [Terriglobales bacterium]MEA2618982.1 hypothetical protein [Chloroflexota bacterium]
MSDDRVSDTSGAGTAASPAPAPDAAAPAVVLTSSPAERNAARQAERRLVVYLDEVQRHWLRGVEADALRDDVRLSASAIVRLAIDELRARGIGWQGLADRLPEGADQPTGNEP